jgi:hypothetical protein
MKALEIVSEFFRYIERTDMKSMSIIMYQVVALQMIQNDAFKILIRKFSAKTH